MLFFKAEAFIDLIAHSKSKNNGKHLFSTLVPAFRDCFDVLDELLTVILEIDLLEFQGFLSLLNSKFSELDNRFELRHIVHDILVLHGCHLELLFGNTKLIKYLCIDLHSDFLHFGEAIDKTVQVGIDIGTLEGASF